MLSAKTSQQFFFALNMSVLFGGSIADELAETVRKYKEEFDSIDIDSHFKHNQWKNKSRELTAKRLQSPPKIIRQKATKRRNRSRKSQVSKSIENNSKDEDVNSFINDSDYDPDASKHKALEPSADDVEYLDVRQQTVFRYSDSPKISRFDKRRNAKKSSLAYIKNNNVRTLFKNKKKNTLKEGPFMNSELMRQNFMIDRSRKDHSMIKSKERISKLARNNLQFLKEIMTATNTERKKKSLLFNNGAFNRRLRFSLGAPNKRRQRNYAEFQRMMKNKQTAFEDKKDLFLERGLRVQNQLNNKVLFHKHGRSKIWNAGRTKSKKGKRRGGGKVGGYEFAKKVNEW